MDRIEMVEKLRQKAKVSYEEAKNALEHSDWDLLDALVYLEGQGRMAGKEAGNYSTQTSYTSSTKQQELPQGGFARLFAGLGSLISKGNAIQLEALHQDRVVISLPLTVLALLLIFMFWWVVPIMLIALFLGVRYRIKGLPQAEDINQAMDKAAQTAEQLKQKAREASTEDRKKKG